jgi:hypothetical protein
VQSEAVLSQFEWIFGDFPSEVFKCMFQFVDATSHVWAFMNIFELRFRFHPETQCQAISWDPSGPYRAPQGHQSEGEHQADSEGISD